MKPVLITLATLAATPVLAHSGNFVHSHGSDPSWLPILLAGLTIAGAAALGWIKAK